MHPENSIVLINKPLGWTSFDVVNKIRYAVIKKMRNDFPELFAGKKLRPKVGHAGTLDPLATGLLIVCIGKETKNIDIYTAQEKEYTGTFYLGATTPSFDKETEVNSTFDISSIAENDIFETATKIIGEIEQIPPMYSAIKKDGKRLYASARAGTDLKLEPRKVFIKEFEITKIEMPLIYFRIVCSKGTYIRSIARDFGKALHNGAFLDSLCRSRIGNYKLEDAMNVEDFVNSMQV